MMNVVLFDDEEMGVEVIRFLLAADSDIQIDGLYTNPLEALAHVEQKDVDAVFLDIEMVENVTMEVAFLQSQMKPHFMFNVLNTINAMTYIDPDQASQLIENLSTYLRGSFGFHNTAQLISIEQELSLIQAYVSIEQARFRNKIKMVYDLPEEYSSLRVPPLALQTLMEGSLYHKAKIMKKSHYRINELCSLIKK